MTVEVTIKVPNNFVGPETGTIEIREDDTGPDDTVGSATYTFTLADIGNNNTGKVTTTVTLNCYAANADCECDFGTRPDDIDDEHGDHTIYATDLAFALESFVRLSREKPRPRRRLLALITAAVVVGLDAWIYSHWTTDPAISFEAASLGLTIERADVGLLPLEKAIPLRTGDGGVLEL